MDSLGSQVARSVMHSVVLLFYYLSGDNPGELLLFIGHGSRILRTFTLLENTYCAK